MSFSKWWFQRRAKNPALNDEESKMTISVAEFRRQQEIAFNAGRLDGLSAKEPDGKSDSFSRLYNNIFVKPYDP